MINKSWDDFLQNEFRQDYFKKLSAFLKKEYAEKLAIPEGYKFYIAIAVGYPDTEKQQHSINFDKDVSVI